MKLSEYQSIICPSIFDFTVLILYSNPQSKPRAYTIVRCCTHISHLRARTFAVGTCSSFVLRYTTAYGRPPCRAPVTCVRASMPYVPPCRHMHPYSWGHEYVHVHVLRATCTCSAEKVGGSVSQSVRSGRSGRSVRVRSGQVRSSVCL